MKTAAGGPHRLWRMTKPPLWPIIAAVVVLLAFGAALLMFLRALLVLS